MPASTGHGRRRASWWGSEPGEVLVALSSPSGKHAPVANDLGIAGLMLDVVGALLLVRGLVFQPAERYAAENPGPLFLRSANPKQDLAHAESAAEAAVGIGLIVLGFIGQLLGNGLVHENSTTEGLAYAGVVLALGIGWLSMPVVRMRRERAVYRAQQALYRDGVGDVDSQWRAELAAQGRDPALVDEWRC
jgi:hypothetical protein